MLNASLELTVPWFLMNWEVAAFQPNATGLVAFVIMRVAMEML